ncbi:MAG: toll/interleukin-1 receptor domain-containing protein [Thermoanaerobaculia bacterium]
MLARQTPSLLEAERLYLEALERSAYEGFEFNVAAATYQLGLLEQLLGRWQEAATRFREALNQFEPLVETEPKARDGVKMCHYYLGQTLLRCQRPHEARDHLEMALKLSEALGDSQLVRAARKLIEESSARPPSAQSVSAESPPLRGSSEELSVASAHREPRVGPQQARQLSRSIVWVVSFTRGVGGGLVSSIKGALIRTAPNTELVSRVLSERDSAHGLGAALREHPQLCAIVVTLERRGLTDPGYLEFLRCCISLVARRDDFRLYVVPHDIALDELRTVASDEAREVLDQLKDTVQQVENTSTLCRSLGAYLGNLEEIRKRAAWRRLRLRARFVAGIAAGVLEALCVPVSLLLVFWLPVWDTKATLREYVGLEWLVALICGVAAVPFLSVVLYVFTRHGVFPVGIWRDRSLLLLGFVASLVGPHALGVPIRLGAPVGYILLGIAFGFVLDEARRRGYSAKREHRVIDPGTIAGRHGRMRPELRRQAGSTWINPWRCPLLPVVNPRVFISYARDSTWACGCAQKLETELSQIGATFFRDTAIPAGGAWRRELNAHLGQATIFLAFVDDIVVEKKWPAAEMEAALAGRSLTGSPDIIAVRSPGLPSPGEDTWRWLAVFRAVLADDKEEAETGPEVMEYSVALPKAIAYKLHPRTYRSVSVFPGWLAKLLARLWWGPRLAFQLWGSLGARIGFLALLIGLPIDWFSKVDSGAWLSEHGWLAIAVLSCAVLLGHTVMLVLAARFHVRSHRANRIIVAQGIGALGLLILIARWGRYADALLLGWACVLCLAAFAAAHQFCQEWARAEPGFIAPVD